MKVILSIYSMPCVYFRIHRTRIFKNWVNDYINNIRNVKNSHELHKRLIHLAMISKAINLASRTSYSQYQMLLEKTLKHPKESMSVYDTYVKDVYLSRLLHTLCLININRLDFVKSVGLFENIKYAPIFEVRVHGYTAQNKYIDFGFRCIFFIVKYPLKVGSYYQCYTIPVSKKKVELGFEQTNRAIIMTFNEYKKYNSNDRNYGNEFVHKNLIHLPFL